MASWVSLLPLSRVKPHPNPSPNLLIPPILLCETRQWPYPIVILANITRTCNNPSSHLTTTTTRMKTTTTSDRYYTLTQTTPMRPSSNRTVQDRFAGGSMSRYVMYVYLNNVSDCAWIVDFNVRGGRTDCGPLFDDWSELWRLATARAR
jgi:hypothetical protein